MTDVSDQTRTEAENETRSRGRLEIFEPKPMKRPPTPEQMAEIDMAGAARGIDYKALIDDDHTEEEVVDAIGEMTRVIATGFRNQILFDEDGRRSKMNLEWAYFPPDFQLFRHSHPAAGDCLYYIIGGSLILGSKTLGPGSGFFVTAEMAYKYKTGPEGVEFLEFRAGGGVPGTSGTKMGEPSVEAIRELTERNKAVQHTWATAPAPTSHPLYDPAAANAEG